MKQKVIITSYEHSDNRLKKKKSDGYFCAWITNHHVPGAIIEVDGHCRWFMLAEFKFVYDKEDKE